MAAHLGRHVGRLEPVCDLADLDASRMAQRKQAVQELGLELLGPMGAVDEGEGALWIGGYLGNRCLSIAGGTSEIQRNVIGERLLGLPRDPEPAG